MKDRLAQLMQDKKLTALRMAEILEVQPSNISHILSGRNNPNYDFMLKLVERFSDVNPDWMFLGQGDMYRKLTIVEQPIAVPVIDRALNTEIIASPIEIPQPIEHKIENSIDVIDQLSAKKHLDISKIIVFYTDGTFESFLER